MPKFHVQDTFAIEAKSQFLFSGSVVEGEIRPGMSVRIPINSATAITAPIDSIEFARKSGGPEIPCLCIRYSNPDEFELWRSLAIAGEILEITADASK